MFQFLLGVLILASNFLGVSRAIAEMGVSSGPGVPAATAASTPLCQQPTTTQIKTLQDLRTKVGTTGNYCLANDIDASPTAATPFTPIGSDSNPFIGVFEGNGHVIDKLTIGPTNFSGLFGSIGRTGSVRNVGITNGALVSDQSAGLLVGQNNGVVTNCFATGAVSGFYGPSGGLIGWNKWQVTNSHAMVFVQGTNATGGTGGFVGLNDTTGTITQSYASGQVFPSSRAQDVVNGGFVGVNNGTITKSYATGNVAFASTIGRPVGGFVGGNGVRLLSHTRPEA